VSVEQRTQSFRVGLSSDKGGTTKDLRIEFGAEIQGTPLDIQATKTLVEATRHKSKPELCVAAAERQRSVYIVLQHPWDHGRQGPSKAGRNDPSVDSVGALATLGGATDRSTSGKTFQKKINRKQRNE
jgi:hypothetical protein